MTPAYYRTPIGDLYDLWIARYGERITALHLLMEAEQYLYRCSEKGGYEGDLQKTAVILERLKTLPTPDPMSTLIELTRRAKAQGHDVELVLGKISDVSGEQVSEVSPETGANCDAPTAAREASADKADDDCPTETLAPPLAQGADGLVGQPAQLISEAENDYLRKLRERAQTEGYPREKLVVLKPEYAAQGGTLGLPVAPLAPADLAGGSQDCLHTELGMARGRQVAPAPRRETVLEYCATQLARDRGLPGLPQAALDALRRDLAGHGLPASTEYDLVKHELARKDTRFPVKE